MKNNRIFKLFASCIPVAGALNHVVCDLQRQDIFNISEGLFEILTQYPNKTANELKSIYDFKYDDEIDYYLNFLIENELGFYCDNPERFPEIDFKYKWPAQISNAIIEYETPSPYDLKKVINELENLGCRFIDLRLYKESDVNVIINIISKFDESKIKFLSLVIKYSPELNIDDLKNIRIRYQRIGELIVHSCPVNTLVLDNDEGLITVTTQKINDNSHCGVVSPKYFNLNKDLFSESLQFNSCLNKKVSIDALGNIRNCPSLPRVYGNVNSNSITHSIKDDTFKSYWGINKDQIDICKVCEYRYICTDCRAFIEDENNILSKPKKCGYDPYTGVWDNENLINS